MLTATMNGLPITIEEYAIFHITEWPVETVRALVCRKFPTATAAEIDAAVRLAVRENEFAPSADDLAHADKIFGSI